MSIAATLFKRFKQQKAITERPARERYLEFVRELAVGNEVELDELQMVCDVLAITEQQLQKDIEIQQRRFEAVDVIAKADDATKKLAELEHEQQSLIRRKYEVCTPIDQRLNELHGEILTVRSDATRRVVGQNYLIQNPLDVSIIEQEHDIRQRRSALMPRLREIEAALTDSHDRKMGAIMSARASVRHYSQRSKLSKSELELFRKAKATLAESEDYALALEDELKAIKRQFADLDDEQAALDKRKLQA